ncbi:hypothetical protein AB0L71_28400 [Streptomyces sp. NPDC052052]|uniref:hypothetical protein n=1 Tax=Streptomyces sp. NPDC052052 TaxID=3154756 RepID=UPI00342B22C3
MSRKSSTKTRTRTAPKLATTKPTPAVLPVRPARPDFLAEAQTAAYHAALLANLPQRRIQDWAPTPGGGAHLLLSSGTRLQHLPGTDIPFTVLTPCAQGATHTTPISTRAHLDHAAQAAAHCTDLHGRPRTLTLHQAATTNADTQTLDTTALRNKAADDQPKEHPEP